MVFCFGARKGIGAALRRSRKPMAGPAAKTNGGPKARTCRFSREWSHSLGMAAVQRRPVSQNETTACDDGPRSSCPALVLMRIDCEQSLRVGDARSRHTAKIGSPRGKVRSSSTNDVEKRLLHTGKNLMMRLRGNRPKAVYVIGCEARQRPPNMWELCVIPPFSQTRGRRDEPSAN